MISKLLNLMWNQLKIYIFIYSESSSVDKDTVKLFKEEI